MQDFQAAAERHYRDAELLAAGNRWPNADHLAGFAAECALKEMLLRFLGAQATGGRPYSMVNGAKQEHGHLPGLWTQVVALLAGRQSSPTTVLLLMNNPYQDWSVNDRYQDGSHVSAVAAGHRVGTAKQLLAHLAAAKVLGSLS